MAERNEGEDLLLAISQEEHEKLVELASLNKSKKSPYTFESILRALTQEEVKTMWAKLSNSVISLTETAISSSNDCKAPIEDKPCYDINLIIQASMDIAFAILQERLPLPEGLLHMAIFFNRVMFQLPTRMDPLKDNIALLCERIIVFLSQDQELMSYNAVIHLFQQSLKDNAAKKYVKRIYALRYVIPEFAVMPEVDQVEILDLFDKCAISALYLSMPEGQKIISTIFTISAYHANKIHNVIKNYLQSANQTQGSAYGKIYFDAWFHAKKTESKTLINQIEAICFQEIIMAGILTKQKSLLHCVRKFLAQFQGQKKDNVVSKMLYSLCFPTFWSFLKNEDGVVRANTATLYLSVFPLEDPYLRRIESEQELNDQMLLVKDLLVNEFPIVRCATVVGLCISMSVNWELFSKDILKTYFKIIVNELAFDSNAPELRCAVVKGFKVLMENPLTFPTLQIILPKITNLFHDNSEPVRIAFIQLLTRVKKIASIKYYDIITAEHLLARMECDPAVAKPIVTLLVNSYFPKNEGPDSWLARCITMIDINRGASRIFFRYASSMVALGDIAKFMVQVVTAIYFYTKSKEKTKGNKLKKKSFPLSKSLSEAEALEDKMPFHQPNIVGGLLDAVVISWLGSLHNLEKPENKHFLKLIISRIGNCVAEMDIYYKDSPVWESISYLSSFMPAHMVPCLGSLCFLRLKKLSPDAKSADYMTLVRCLFNHDQSAGLIELLQEWIQFGLSQTFKELSAKESKSKLGIRKTVEEMFHPMPGLAVNILTDILDDTQCQEFLVDRHDNILITFLGLTDDIKREIEISSYKDVGHEQSNLYSKLLFVLQKMSLLLHTEGKHDVVTYIEDIHFWMEEKLISPFLSCTPLNSSSCSITVQNGPPKAFEKLIVTICMDSCRLIADMCLLGICDLQSLKFLKFGLKLLSLPKSGSLLVHVCLLLRNHTAHGVYLLALEKPVTSLMNIVPDCFNKLFQCLKDKDFFTSIPSSDEKNIQSLLYTTVQLMQPHSTLKELFSSIMSSVMKNIFYVILTGFEDWDEFEKNCEPFETVTISKAAEFLILTVCVKTKLLMYFLRQLQKYLEKTEKNIPSFVACYIIIVKILDIKNSTKCVKKRIGTLVDKMRGLLPENYTLKTIGSNVLLPDCTINNEAATSRENDKTANIIRFEEHCRLQHSKLKNRL